MPYQRKLIEPLAVSIGAVLALFTFSGGAASENDSAITRPANAEAKSAVWRLIRPEIAPQGDSLANILARTQGYSSYKGIAVVDNEYSTARLYPVTAKTSRSVRANMDEWLAEFEQMKVDPGTELWLHKNIWKIADNHYSCGPPFLGHYVKAIGRSRIRRSLERLLSHPVNIDQIIKARGETEGWEEYEISAGVYQVERSLMREVFDAYEAEFAEFVVKERSTGSRNNNSSATQKYRTAAVANYRGIEFPAGSYYFWWRDRDFTQSLLISPTTQWIYYQTELDE
jgi:hypothetical protein